MTPLGGMGKNPGTRGNRVFGSLTESAVVNLNSNYKLAFDDDKILKFSVGINKLLDDEYDDHQSLSYPYLFCQNRT